MPRLPYNGWMSRNVPKGSKVLWSQVTSDAQHSLINLFQSALLTNMSLHILMEVNRIIYQQFYAAIDGVYSDSSILISKDMYCC